MQGAKKQWKLPPPVIYKGGGVSLSPLNISQNFPIRKHGYSRSNSSQETYVQHFSATVSFSMVLISPKRREKMMKTPENFTPLVTLYCMFQPKKCVE
jgi:hypothetical protein